MMAHHGALRLTLEHGCSPWSRKANTRTVKTHPGAVNRAHHRAVKDPLSSNRSSPEATTANDRAVNLRSRGKEVNFKILQCYRARE
jgi:hypothetical protein